MTPLDAALRYGARGWPVIPLRGKLPRTPNGLKDASTSKNVIEEWWRRWPDANVAIVTGRKAGVWVIDVDGSRGSSSLTELEGELGALPETLDQQTGGGGRHLFFSWPEGHEIRNRQNVRPGIDVRGEGGYIVAPPSVHPDSGKPYMWTSSDKGKIAEAPAEWIALAAPKRPSVAPWEKVSPAPRPQRLKTSTPAVERAKRYLDECDPAIQGSGGHNALLWAARALVVGFELDDGTALDLLWGYYNPRCQPSWDREDERERRDFERKVAEARRTPSEKRRGWLLEEYGLKSAKESLADLARGEESARNLIAAAVARAHAVPPPTGEDEEETPEAEDREPFPLDLFPGPIAEYLRQVVESHQVDPSFAGLPALAVGAAAMGNAWRLRMKRDWLEAPVLWVGLVAPSGANKSGPLKQITSPLTQAVPVAEIEEAMLNPQSELVVGDATLEAVVARMQESPRGLLVFRDELAGWANGFNAYRKGGGDEQAWLEFWGGGSYTVDRKTNNERIRIPAAAACVLGGIQPKILASCFDPGQFASGLVPRILIACPPRRSMFWTEVETTPAAEESWSSAVSWLRSRPFAGLDPNRSLYQPHVCDMSAEAKSAYVTFFNAVGLEIEDAAEDNERAFLSKVRRVAPRLALVHHGLALACAGEGIRLEVQRESLDAGIAWARWCLEEQLRVYSFGAALHRKQEAANLLISIQERLPTGTATVRQVQRLNQRRYKKVKHAIAAMSQLVEMGHARWADARHRKIALLNGAHA